MIFHIFSFVDNNQNSCSKLVNDFMMWTVDHKQDVIWLSWKGLWIFYHHSLCSAKDSQKSLYLPSLSPILIKEEKFFNSSEFTSFQFCFNSSCCKFYMPIKRLVTPYVELCWKLQTSVHIYLSSFTRT